MSIVERLRAKASIYISDDFDEAADTIEELHAALSLAHLDVTARWANGETDGDTLDVVRAALRRVEEKV